MSLLFADIYDGIRCIRITKGVCERDILNYVQEKAGGCMNVGNVLKTIRTLKKLVEDGVLLKKGKRYMFAPKSEDDAEEEEDDDEDVNDEMDDENGGEDEEGGEEEEEEEDDEEDDDDDDEDEDDDDDDECDQKEGLPQEENKKRGNENGQKEVLKVPTKPKPSTNGDDDENCNDAGSRAFVQKSVNRVFCKSQEGKRTAKEALNMQQEADDGNSKGGEAIAFCARDFMDSQSQSNSEEISEGPNENVNLFKRVGNLKPVRLKKRKSRMRNLEPRKFFRSKSRLRGVKAAFHDCQKNDPFDGAGFCPSNSLQESMDVDMCPEEGAEKGGSDTTPLEISGLVDRQESCCSKSKLGDNESGEPAEKGKNLSQTKLSHGANHKCCLLDWTTAEDDPKRYDFLKRSLSSSNQNGSPDDGCPSVCSVCEKKIRSS